MARYQGGETVNAGFYLNAAEWHIEVVSGAGAALPGPASHAYRRIPAVVMLLAAPLLGAAFAFFLPFIGLALVLQHAAKQAWRFAGDAGHAAMVAMSPRLAAGEAHPTGDTSAAAKATGPEARLDELAKDLEATDRDDVR